MEAGFELEVHGLALQVGGQVPCISDSDIEKQELLAKKAALEEELQRLRLATALANYQATQWERQSADAVKRKTETLRRVRAIRYSRCSARPNVFHVSSFLLLAQPWRSSFALLVFVVDVVPGSPVLSDNRCGEAGGTSPFQTPSPKSWRPSTPPLGFKSRLTLQIRDVAACVSHLRICARQVLGKLCSRITPHMIVSTCNQLTGPVMEPPPSRMAPPPSRIAARQTRNRLTWLV